jgi:hypothetical protein
MTIALTKASMFVRVCALSCTSGPPFAFSHSATSFAHSDSYSHIAHHSHTDQSTTSFSNYFKKKWFKVRQGPAYLKMNQVMMTKKNIVCGMISLVHKITGTNTYE